MELNSELKLQQLEMISACFERSTFSPHIHEGFSIAMVQQGTQRFQRDRTTHLANPGQLLLINADQLHDGESANPHLHCRYHALYPQPELLLPVVEDLCGPGAGLPWFDPVVDDPQLAQFLAQLFQPASSTADLLSQQVHFLQGMALLIQRHSRKYSEFRPLINAPDKVRTLRHYLDAHCNEVVSLNTLSRLVNLNPSYLTRLFVRHTGIPPQHYQLMRRVERAQQLIRQGLPLIDTALQTGFTDQAHFSRHFKRFTGLPPGRYQRALR
ncbi:MAG: AraC family transcriptional regulator [Marinobacterium sp.]|nr:AraC family transcriptional regulator [Marinobacterium sp.]